MDISGNHSVLMLLPLSGFLMHGMNQVMRTLLAFSRPDSEGGWYPTVGNSLLFVTIEPFFSYANEGLMSSVIPWPQCSQT